MAPHPDDESIGCGALIEKYSSHIDVMAVTNGELGNPEWTRNRTRRIRKIEFKNAMNKAGIHKCFMLNLPDSQLNEKEHCLNKFDFGPYDFIFVPNRNDNHPDHKAVYKYVITALTYQGITRNVCEYEIWTPLTEFDRYIYHDGTYKKLLISNYVSQLKHIDYIRMMHGLGEYRGGYLNAPKGCACEVYKAEIIGRKRCWFSKIKLF